MAGINQIRAREILDSRGNPTVEVDVFLDDGARGRASVPSGASTGKAEAVELRDGDARRYLGRGVRQAVANAEMEILLALRGMEGNDQRAIDRALVELDGAKGKRRLGANAVLGVSLAVARAAAASAGLPLYRYLGGGSLELPVPMVNILSGGLHGGGNADFQDYLMVPLRAERFSEALEDSVAVYRAMKDVLKERGLYTAGVAEEGGYAPRLRSNELGFELMVAAIERAGLHPGADAAIAVDVAASQFYDRGRYHLEVEGTELDSAELVGRLEAWAKRYPILCIEDGLAEDDGKGWKLITERLGGRCQLIGDDLFVTQAERLNRGIEAGWANAVLVKLNQVGTLSEAIEAIELARQNGYGTIVSARSGETEDDLIADFAVAMRAGQIKIGSVTRSERLAKYNRLLRIEDELGQGAAYRGEDVFADWLSPLSGQ